MSTIMTLKTKSDICIYIYRYISLWGKTGQLTTTESLILCSLGGKVVQDTGHETGSVPAMS